MHSLMESIVREEHEHEIAAEEQQEEEGKIAFIPASATNFSFITVCQSRMNTSSCLKYKTFLQMELSN